VRVESQLLKGAIAGVLTGVLGFALAWSAWHLYIDHQDLHALITIEQARRSAPVAAGPPPTK